MRFVQTGEATTLVVSLLHEGGFEEKQFYAIPIASRPGGGLLAIPINALPQERLDGAQLAGEEAIFGPSTVIDMELLEEDEQGEVVKLGLSAQVVCIDCSDGIWEWSREYDPVTDSLEEIGSFSDIRAQALPNVEAALPAIYAWAENTAGRVNFYSAREEPMEPVPTTKGAAVVAKKAGVSKRLTTAVLAEQVQQLASQVSSLVEGQKLLQQRLVQEPTAKAADVQQPGGLLLAPKLPALSSSLSPPKGLGLGNAVAALGPPPKTKALNSGLVSSTMPNANFLDEPVDVFQPQDPALQDPMLAALTQQSAAMTALVAHIAGGETL